MFRHPPIPADDGKALVASAGSYSWGSMNFQYLAGLTVNQVAMNVGGTTTSVPVPRLDVDHEYDNGTDTFCIDFSNQNGDNDININHDARDISTAAARFRLFRNTNSSGSKRLTVFEGDGTATVSHDFYAGGGYVCGAATGGNLGGGTINSENKYFSKWRVRCGRLDKPWPGCHNVRTAVSLASGLSDVNEIEIYYSRRLNKRCQPSCLIAVGGRWRLRDFRLLR